MRTAFNPINKEYATNRVILAIAFFALCLRLFRLDGHSLWDDELYSVGLVSLTAPWFSGVDVGKSPHLLALSDTFWTWKLSDPHPPLYELCLAVWVTIFGVSDWAVRSLSAVIGAATVVTALRMPKAVGRFARTVFAMLLAVSPMLLFYSQEARSYVLGALLSACLCVELLRVLTDEHAVNANGIPPVPLLATGALLCFTHYYGALLVLCCAVAAALHQHLRGRKIWGSVLGWGVALAPLIAYIGVARAGVFGKLSVPVSENNPLWQTLWTVFQVFGQTLFSVQGTVSLAILLAVLLGIWASPPLASPSAAQAELNELNELNNRQHVVRRASAYLACVCGTYLLLLAAAVRHADFFHIRYLIFAVPPGLLLLTMATGVNNWRQIATTLTLAGLMPIGVQSWMDIQRELPQHRGEWRGAAQFVAKVHVQGDVVVAPHRPTRMYYAHYLSRYIPLPLDSYLLGVDNAAQMLQWTEGMTVRPPKIIIFSHEDFRSVVTSIEALASQKYGCLTQDKRAFGALQVVVMACERGATAPAQSSSSADSRPAR